MMNLFERLKPELRDSIEAEKDQYPISYEYRKKNLSEIFYVIDLRYEDFCDLESRATRLKIPFDNAWDFFVDE